MYRRPSNNYRVYFTFSMAPVFFFILSYNIDPTFNFTRVPAQNLEDLDIVNNGF